MNGVTSQELSAEKELTEERIKRIDEALKHVREMADSQRTSDQRAIETALTAAKEMSEAHNGLLRKMEVQAETYSTKIELDGVRSWQARLTGGLLVVSVIGITNLVKLWGG